MFHGTARDGAFCSPNTVSLVEQDQQLSIPQFKKLTKTGRALKIFGVDRIRHI